MKKYIWKIDLNDYMNAIKLAQERGKVEGDNFEEELLAVLKAKQIKPMGTIDTSIEDFIKDAEKQGTKILDMRKFNKKEGDTK